MGFRDESEVSFPDYLEYSNSPKEITMKTLRPTDNYIVVRSLESAEPPPEPEDGEEMAYRPRGGLEWGEVLAVGPGSYRACSGERSPMEVEVGDVVLYDDHSGDELLWEGETLLIMSDYAVRAIRDDDGAVG